MQLGSGTYDIVPGLTWTAQDDDVSTGAQLLFRHPLNENDRGYRRGTRADLTAWVAQEFNEQASGSVRLAYARWKDISGFDDTRGRLTVGLRLFDKGNGFFADVSYGREFGESGSIQSGGVQFGIRF